MDEKPTASTGSIASLHEKYNYNESIQLSNRATDANDEIEHKREEMRRVVKPTKERKPVSLDYTLTMIDMDTLHRVNDDIKNNKLNDDDITVDIPKRKPRKKKGMYITTLF